MLTLNDGRSELWQWDTGRKLTVDADCSQVHFSNKVFGRSVDVDVVDGVAIIPDILLQSDKELTAWAFVGTAENGYTKISKVFKVNKRNKPTDYVFTPPEQTTLQELVERLDAIEESQDPDAIKNAVDDYLASNPIQVEETDPTVPDWAKQPEKPNYTAEEVGALPADTVIPEIPAIPSKLPNPHALTFTGSVEATYDGSKPLEVVIPQGGGATDEQIASAVAAYMAEHPVESSGLTQEQIAALDNMFKVCAFTKEDVSAEYNAFCTAFGIEGGIVPDEPDEPDTPTVTLTSISASYSGGDVTVGTAVNDLTGIVVTAHYSDGSTASVSDYTLSGTIAEGSNTITVTYQGKTASFTVTGVAEPGGEETGVSNETTWTDGVAYTYDFVQGEYVDKANGSFITYDGWNRTPYLCCDGASKLCIVVKVDNNLTGVGSNASYNAFYDEDKNFAQPFSFEGVGDTAGDYMEVEIPSNAKYFVMSNKSKVFTASYIELVPYA